MDAVHERGVVTHLLGQRAKEVTHTLLMLEGLVNPSPALAWGVLLHDVGKPPTFRVAERIRFDGHVEAGVELAWQILTRLRFPHDDIDRIQELVANHMRFRDLPRMRQSTAKRFLRIPYFEEHLELHRLDCLGSHRNLENYEVARAKLAELPAEQLQPPPLINGDDLIALGYKPGPVFRKVLSAVEDAQLEGGACSREEALALAKTLLNEESKPLSRADSRH